MKHNLLLTIAKYSMWEATRDRFLIFISIGVFILFLISMFVSELAITEGAQIQITILSSALRLFSIFTMSLFVITSMIREFNDKGFELILSHPVTRTSYYFGKFIGFSVIAFFIIIMCFCCLCFYVPSSMVLMWSISLFCELLIIISLSLLCLFSFNSITISFSVVMAFYFLSRTIDVIQLISESPILESNSISQKFINGLLDIIAYIIPELYNFTRSEWLIYIDEINPDLFPVIGQTLIYIVFLSCVALFDLYRKEL